MTQDTLKQRRARGLRQASQATRTLTTDEEFAHRVANLKDEFDTGPVVGENEGATQGGSVTARSRPRVTLYKPSPQGYTPRTVTAGSVGVLLADGWRAHCPHCGGDHGPEVNACPGKDPMAVRICPVCGKRIADNRVNAYNPEEDEAADDDPNVIHDEAYAATTPASRTKAALDWHIWNRHPQEAREMGLPPVPEAPRLNVPDALSGVGLAAVMPQAAQVAQG